MKRTKIAKVLAAVLALVMIVACLAACGEKKQESQGSGAEASGDAYVIGLSGPLTGGAAFYGQSANAGAQLAVDEINAAGGVNGHQLKLIVVDDMHDATKISTNYASLMDKGMQVSLGTVTTAPGKEWTNISVEDNLFFMTPSASNDDIPKYSNGYQMCFSDNNQGTAAANLINRDYPNAKIGVFYKSDDAYSQGIYKTFMANIANPDAVVEAVFTDANTTDFSTQVNALKDCTLIFMPIYYDPASLFMTQAKDLVAKDLIYFGCDGLDGIDALDGFDITAIPQEVSMLSHFNSKATEGAAAEFIAAFSAVYGANMLSQFGASAYDCVYAIAGAIEAAGVEPGEDVSTTCDKLVEVFQGGYSYTGVTGTNITWDKDGFVNKEAIKYIIKAAN